MRRLFGACSRERLCAPVKAARPWRWASLLPVAYGVWANPAWAQLSTGGGDTNDYLANALIFAPWLFLVLVACTARWLPEWLRREMWPSAKFAGWAYLSIELALFVAVLVLRSWELPSASPLLMVGVYFFGTTMFAGLVVSVFFVLVLFCRLAGRLLTYCSERYNMGRGARQ